MSEMSLVLLVGGVVIAVVLVAVLMKRGDSSGYRRRFAAPTPLSSDARPHRDDAAFPFMSTLYVGDGGGASHSHHSSTDCASGVDGGSDCADGGGSSGS